mmetsp:Transcript_63924/g.183744  ORF Transcript_63924/g.183744 Transcript_63924/m.183744 type:complete len:219 (+) Transcript_63924:1573-2229(+)
MRGKWALTLRSKAGLTAASNDAEERASSRPPPKPRGERGGDPNDLETAASVTTQSSDPRFASMSSSPAGMAGGDSGESVGVATQAIVPDERIEVCKMMFDKMAVAADTPPGELENTSSSNMEMALSDVSCLSNSSPKQSDSLWEIISIKIKVMFSCVSEGAAPSRKRFSNRMMRPSVGNTWWVDCSTTNKRENSSAMDLNCNRSKKRSRSCSEPCACK